MGVVMEIGRWVLAMRMQTETAQQVTSGHPTPQRWVGLANRISYGAGGQSQGC